MRTAVEVPMPASDRPTIAKPREQLPPVAYADTVRGYVYEVFDDAGVTETIVTVREEEEEQAPRSETPPPPMPLLLSPWVHAETITKYELPASARRRKKAQSSKVVLVGCGAFGLTLGVGIAAAFWQAVFGALW